MSEVSLPGWVRWDADVAVRRPMVAEEAVAAARTTQPVREDDDRPRTRSSRWVMDGEFQARAGGVGDRRLGGGRGRCRRDRTGPR